jgi:hypothetical protein
MQILSLVSNEGYFLYSNWHSSQEISFINSRSIRNFGSSWNITNIAEYRCLLLMAQKDRIT